MDTITHGIVGALVGKALFAGDEVPALSRNGVLTAPRSAPTARAAIFACTIGSVFPDIDIFAGQIARNPLAIMVWHRNITHSLVLLPVWAAILAGLSLPLARWLDWKRPSFPILFLIFATGLASHIFLDVLTNFGTMVWSPVNYSRVSWDWLFILDLSLTSFALVPQLAAWCYREPEKFPLRAAFVWTALTIGAFGGYALAAAAGYGFALWVVATVSTIFAAVIFAPVVRRIGFRWTRANWCEAGLALACLYLVAASAMHRRALTDVTAFAAAHQMPSQNLAALPLPPTLTHWSGLITTPEGVWRTTFSEPANAVEKTQFFASAPPDRFIDEAKKLHGVQVYLWFSRFPSWQERQRGDETVLDLTDVRFIRDTPTDPDDESTARARVTTMRPGSNGFTFEIIYDAGGQITSSGFRKPQR